MLIGSISWRELAGLRGVSLGETASLNAAF